MLNKKLKNLISLDCKVMVFIPTTTDVNKKADNTKEVNNCLSLLSECFGGATSTNALGCWISQNEGLVKENITLCYSYTTTDGLNQNIEKVIEFCEMLKKTMKQEAISLEVNGQLYFI